MPQLGNAKHRIGQRLGSGATTGEGTQNLLCAYLAAGVLASLALNAAFGLWWADPAVALAIAVLAVKEGRQTWQGKGCCATPQSPTNTSPPATTTAAADCRDRAQPKPRPAARDGRHRDDAKRQSRTPSSSLPHLNTGTSPSSDPPHCC